MKTMKSAIALAAGLSAMVVSDAYGGIRVLLLGDTSTPSWVADVQAKIQATGRVDATFDIFASQTSTPTLAALKGYDVVLMWSDRAPANPTALGNVMADYVDAGGAVVETAFSFDPFSFGIQGRWRTGNYSAINATNYGGGPASIGARQVPSHPILNGVGAFNGGASSYHYLGTVNPGCYRIADWSDGAPLVATNHSHAGKVAALNFFPPSSDVRSDFWTAGTGGAILLANAINFAANNTGDVLLCGSPVDPAWASEVRDRMLESGRVGGRIDLFDIGAGTPPVATLRQYDSVLVYTDRSSANPTALGDNLADYVDQGGGVTISVFALGFGVAGRFVAGGYCPFNIAGQSSGTPLTLGARLIPQHPLLADIGSFSGGGSSYFDTGGLRPGAVRVADWSNGQPLIAAMPGHKGRVAALNFYPPSSVSRNDFWDRSGDGGALLANAAMWTARNDNDVLIIGDNVITGGMDDIRAKVRPMVNGTIDTYDYVTNGAPSLAMMRRYDSILTFGNALGGEADLFGDRLADFVDGGGGVLDMFGANVSGYGPQGRWVSGAYSALTPGSYVVPGAITMSAKLFPLHPAFNLVAALNIGTSGFHGTGGVRPGALRLADLSDGQPLAAEKSTGAGRVLSLNFFPMSNDVFAGNWLPSTDGAQLMANSLNHVARSDIDALILATDPAAGAINSDAVRKIRATGRIRGRIDVVDNTSGNPPIGLLAAYESTLLWSDFPQPDANALGNMLAVYANNGGGVVTTFGAHYGAPFSIGGLWASRPYTPATDGAGFLSSPGATIGVRQSPEHPVLAGVDVFNLGSSGIHDFIGTTRVGERIADLSNGRPLVAEAKIPGARQNLALNMLIASNDGFAGGWDPATKGGLLMANALTYVAADRPCLIDFNNDGFVDFFDYDDYVNCFENSLCPRGRDADINGDGFVDFFDYDAFVAGFERGC